MRRNLVFGLGRFGGGAGAARYLVARGEAVRIADRACADSLAASVRALAGCDLEWRLGCEDPSLLAGIDRVVVNPAVADNHPLLAAARAAGIELTQEVNLFLADYPGRVCLVTGTNGKSTTTHLLARALARAGTDVLAGGNNGRSLLDQLPNWREGQTAIVEISSFQLERLEPEARVAGAVAVRITRDHLDRHGTVAAYHAAKAHVARVARGFFVHAADDGVAAGFTTPAAVRTTYSLHPPLPGQVGLVDEAIHSAMANAPGQVLDRGALRLLGAFNLENAMAAFAAAVHLGASRHDAGLGIATAPALPFRLQAAGRLPDGVTVYDNAVSTDADSTAAALATLASLEAGVVHWVGGGRSKDGDFAGAAARLRPRLQSAFLFGAAAAPLAACLDGVRVEVHGGVTAALAAARRRARAGDAILFSPAFTSFDQYPNFQARAQDFHAWLAAAVVAPASSGVASGARSADC